MTTGESDSKKSVVRGIGSILAALLLCAVGSIFLLATACFGYFGLGSMFAGSKNFDLGVMLLIGALTCGLIATVSIRGLIRILRNR
jgi:hypothetical protein